jgi:hypothetical protein
MQVQGYGELNADNLVQTLAGSYDTFQNPYQRRQINNALVPAFQEKFLGGGGFVAKARSLLKDAQGRHVALYFRNHLAQRTFAHAGLAGNLSTTRRDYLGVFSQNLNGSKSDYWQLRQADLQVALHPDGSADDGLHVLVQNPSPPYLAKAPDPQAGYDTRWLWTSVGVFLPRDARLESATSDSLAMPNASLEHTSMGIRGVLDRPVLRHAWLLPPQGSAQLTAQYAVPHAAAVDRATGDMTYRIDLDPQDLVSPQANAVTLTIPQGYRFGALPSGWTQRDAQTAVLTVPQLVVSGSWQVPVLKD